jgi:site-specific DNA recombinase
MIRTKHQPAPAVRCAIYTRKSTEEGLEQEFNSLDAQRESAEAFIKSQESLGWQCLPDHYDDGGFTGGNMDRPALQRLLADIEAGRIDCVVVYKVDRLSRSLMDFARIIETFEKHHVSFVAVTQQFSTATSMGRLVLNVLLSFAQFEREMISERTRDKIAATRRKGRWSGGVPILGYTVVDKKLIVDPTEAEQVRQIFELYAEHQSLLETAEQLNRRGWATKRWTTKKGKPVGGLAFNKTNLHFLLTNVLYAGKVRYKDEVHAGLHEAIVGADLFHRVQQLLARNGCSGGRDVRNKYGALLKGLLRCTACDCAMSHSYASKGHRRYRYYVCVNAQKRGWKSCPAPSVPAGEMERFVVDQIKAIGRDPAVVAATWGETGRLAEEATKSLQAERERLRRQLRRDEADIQGLAVRGTVTNGGLARLADLQERVRLGEGRLVEIDRELADAQYISAAEVAERLACFEPVWESLSPREQSRLMHLLIERVDFDGVGGNAAITFHPTGIRTFAGEEALA